VAIFYGMTVLCKGRFADSHHSEIACALFDFAGKTVIGEGKHMDAATGLSASLNATMFPTMLLLIVSLEERIAALRSVRLLAPATLPS
jgi:pyrroline-5-carboxylate reductase